MKWVAWFAAFVALVVLVSLVLHTPWRERREADNARARYDLVSRHGSPEEICIAARDVADAYLRTLNERDYARWDVTADLRCNGAAMDR